ncbi:MAG: hypothetical protein DRR42_19885 [Gammaproteobacteria bacterium]|nr:MAG: hypothetical protein DRR42_19885 [Gammaproteobacteria bacterium]
MKMLIPDLTVEEQLREFDLWVTPTTHEIQDTQKYETELKSIQFILHALGPATNEFEDREHCNPDNVAATIINLIEKEVRSVEGYEAKFAEASKLVESFCSLMFLVTGKADNAIKCRFPVYLSNTVRRTNYPFISIRSGKVKVQNRDLPRVLKQDLIAKLIGNCLVCATESDELSFLHDEAIWLLKTYISVILADEKSADQFWILGKNYFLIRSEYPGKESALLAPLIVFKVKGSVSASGGHIPEDLMRDHFRAWGLNPGIDYNTEDVVVSFTSNGTAGEVSGDKTRAYDFVIPYQVEGWPQRLFVQCQVYAGDSGSVSHKVVDQTTSSRTKTIESYPDARFIEYLDGAGYFSSLNGDLSHMLSMGSTHSFVQIRSINIRLRREFQDIGFLTPLEVEVTLLASEDKTESAIKAELERQGYATEEVNRVLTNMAISKLLERSNGQLMVQPLRENYARRILLLDIIVEIGEKLGVEDQSGLVLVPGYGINYGTTMAKLSAGVSKYAPGAEIDVPSFGADISLLSVEGQIILR